MFYAPTSICFFIRIMHLLSKLTHLLCTPVLFHLCYLVSLSFIGFLALKIVKHKSNVTINSPQNIDLFFMSVSSSTVSSMGTIEMEVFSNQQLWVLIFLMIFGGEIFVSILGLQFKRLRLKRKGRTDSINLPEIQNLDEEHNKHCAINHLASITLSYFVSCIVFSSILITLYMSQVPTARRIIERKNIKVLTFSIFLAISSFVNCGFTPTNENMVSFQKDSILQLLIVFMVLAGNTMFPSCLRFLIWVLKKVTKCKHCSNILHNPENIGYEHVFSFEDCVHLTSTVFMFVLVQVVLFCLLEWNSENLEGFSSWQKIMGAVFQSVNARHAGESIFDLSKVTSAVLVLYIVMMYLPSYTRYLPFKVDGRSSANGEGRNSAGLFTRAAIFSQLGFLVIFIIVICITERKAIVEDPLNFSVMNIVFEVISAYGNVGFSLGYSCKRLLNPDRSCKDAWSGFVGRWSNKGKLILVLVMLYGRLKRFCIIGGKAWMFN